MSTCKKHQNNCCCYFLPPVIIDILVREKVLNKDELRGSTYNFGQRMMASRNDISKQGANAFSFLPVAGNADRYIYDSHVTTKLDVDLKRKEGDPDVADNAVNNVYENCGKVRNFYKDNYNYFSVDNKGKDLKMNVHFNVMNALWRSDSDQMFFGEGDGKTITNFASALDVTAHEMTHGVVEYTAGLIYEGQSGALNEHIADVFASVIKQHENGETAALANWLIGETIVGEAWPGRAVRSLKSPGTAFTGDNQPSHMENYDDTTADNGGVHINSGILNKAFYNVAFGINGMKGLDTSLAGSLWFNTLRAITDNRCTFQKFFTTLTSISIDMVTAQKLPINAATLLAEAFADVGIH